MKQWQVSFLFICLITLASCSQPKQSQEKPAPDSATKSQPKEAPKEEKETVQEDDPEAIKKLESLQGTFKFNDKKQATSLNLTNSQAKDSDLELLKGLPSLQSLILKGPNFTDAGVEHVKVLKKLRLLGLENTKVTNWSKWKFIVCWQ